MCGPNTSKVGNGPSKFPPTKKRTLPQSLKVSYVFACKKDEVKDET